MRVVQVSLVCWYLLGNLLYAQAKPPEVAVLPQLLEQLGHPVQAQRRSAMLKLQRLGTVALPYLCNAFKQAPASLRQEIVQVIAAIPTTASVRLLVKALGDRDEGVKSVAVGALIISMGAVGRRAFAEAYQALNDPRLRIYEEFWLEKHILQLLLAKIPPSGNVGRYEGQFRDVVSLGPRTAWVLLKIFQDSNYISNIRQMAGDALGETGNREIIPALKAFFRRTKERTYRDIAAGALVNLGDCSAIDHLIARYIKRIGRGKKQPYLYFQLGYMYLRAKRRHKALRAFQACIARCHGDTLGYKALALYNIACIYSLEHRKQPALEYLRKAIKAGYDEVDWIQEDGDLAFIRKDPEFHKIIQQLLRPSKR